MIVATGLAALWLSAGLAIVALALALRRPEVGSADARTLGAIAWVQAGLCALALAAAIIEPDVGAGAGWALVFALALVIANASPWHRRGRRIGLIALSIIIVVADIWLLAISRPATALAIPTYIGMAALAVAVVTMIAGGTGRLTAVAIRPWTLSAWLALTLALLIAAGDAPSLVQVPAVTGWVAATISLHFVAGRRRARSLASLPSWGAAIAHGGAALAIAGLVASWALAETRTVSLREGQRSAIGPWLIQLNSVTPTAEVDGVALEAELEASRGAGAERLEPQMRYPLSGSARARRIPAAKSLWVGQLSVVMGEREGGAWPIRMSWRPFTGVIRVGLGLALFGGLLIAAARGWRWWRRRPDPDWRRRSYA